MAESGTIDSLQIEIEASSKSAVTQINNLANALRKLKAATNGGFHMGNFKKELGKLGGNEVSKIEKLAQALNGLKNVKLDDKIGNNMLKIADACELIEQQHIDKLTKFGTALQTIKSISTKGYDQLPAAILNIAAAVDSITDDSIARLSRLTIALSRLRGVDLRGLSAVLRAQNQAARAASGNGADSGQSDADGSSGEDELTRRVRQATKPTTAIGSATKSMLQTLAKDLKNVATAALNAAKAIAGKFVSAIKSAASSVGQFGKNIVTAPFRVLTNRVKALNDKMHGLISSFKRVMFYRAIRTVIKELGDAMREGEENAYWYTKTIGDATHYIAEAYDTFASASAMMKNQVGAAWATLFANIEPIITKIVEMVSRAAEVVTMFFAKLGGKNTYLKAIDYSKDWAEETDKGAKAAKEWRNQLMAFDEINRLEAPTDSTSGKGSGTDKDYGAMFVEEEVDTAIGDLADRLRELWESQDWKGLGELIGQTLNDLFPSRDKWKEWGAYIGNGIDGVIQTAYYALKSMDFSEWGSRMADGLNSAIDEIDFDIAGRLFVRKFTALLDLVGGFLIGLDYHDLGKAIGDYFRGALDEASEWLSSYEWGTVSAKLWEKLKAMIDGFDIPSFASSLGNFIVTAANSAADFLNGLDFNDVVTTVIESIKTFFDNLHTDEIKTAIWNLWEAIKTAFKDTMTTFGEWLHSKNEDGAFAQAGKDFNEGIQGFLADLKELSGYVPWDELGTAIGDFMKEIKWREIFYDVWQTVKPYFEAAVNWFFGEESGYLGEKVIGLKLAFDMAGPVLGAVVQGLVLKILNPFKGIRTGLATTAAEATVGLGGLKEVFVAGAKTLGLAAGMVADGILVAYDVKALKDAGTAYGDTQRAINSETDSVLKLFSTIYRTNGEEAAKEWAKATYNIETEGKDFEQINDEIAEAISHQYDDVPKNMWEGLKGGLEEYFSADGKGLWQLVKDGFSAMIKGVKDLLGIHSPSTVFNDIGDDIVQGLLNGIKEKWSDVTSFFDTDIKQLIEDVKTKWEEFKDSASEIWGNVKDIICDTWDDIKENASTTWETIKTEVSAKWDELSEKASTVWDSVKQSISGAWDTITSTTSTVWNGITGTVSSAWDGIKGIASDTWNGVKDAVTGATDDISTDSTADTQTMYNDVTGIYNNLHNEAVRVFTDIGNAVPQIMNYLAQQVETSVQQMENSFTNMQYTVSGAFDTIRANIESAIYAIQGIDWSIPAPHIPHITWYYDTVYSDDGSSFNIPQFDVQWYAKGGVLDKATLFGMGDAGAEALIPLERNTEWIGKVAAEMNRQSSKQSEGRDESNDDVIDALYTICDRIIRAIPDGGDDVDMDSFARTLTKIQRRQARAMG